MLCLIWGCGQKAKDNTDHSMHGDTAVGNQALYEEVMAIHDEVMPKMDDIYKLEQSLKKQLADTTRIAADKKQELESAIAKLDAAGDSMMVWMRKFNPIPDSSGEAKAKQYLLDEKIKITRVKEDMLQAIEEAKKFQ